MMESEEDPRVRSNPVLVPVDRDQRTGTVWTASAHIVTAVIGSAVYLSFAMSQLGWILGLTMLLLSAIAAYYTSNLLAGCYCSGDPVEGSPNVTYPGTVKAILGWRKAIICGVTLYPNLAGLAVMYNIGAANSMQIIERSYRLRLKGLSTSDKASTIYFNLAFGVVQLFLSQIPTFHHIWPLSLVSASMSLTYSTIIIGLGISKLAEARTFKGTPTGIPTGTVTRSQKIFNTFQAMGDLAFVYLYSFVLVEIQDTIRCQLSEVRTSMKKATRLSLLVITIIYVLCGCISYAVFGDSSPANLLTGFGFHNPSWLLDIANAAVVIHYIGAYQVFSQPIFAFFEKLCPAFILRDIQIPRTKLKLNPFRLVTRSIYVVITTLMSMFVPLFKDVVGILGAAGQWRLSVHFPLKMYIAQNDIPKWSKQWVCLHLLSMAYRLLYIAAVVGSVVRFVSDVKAKLA